MKFTKYILSLIFLFSATFNSFLSAEELILDPANYDLTLSQAFSSKIDAELSQLELRHKNEVIFKMPIADVLQRSRLQTVLDANGSLHFHLKTKNEGIERTLEIGTGQFQDGWLSPITVCGEKSECKSIVRINEKTRSIEIQLLGVN